MAPYADFGVFGAFNKQTAKNRKYEVKTLIPPDKIITKLVPGPNGYDQWLESWGVLKSGLIMLNVASPGALDQYQEGIRILTVLFPQSWGDIAQADVNMRWQYMERLLEDLEGAPAGFDPARPWGYIFSQCAYGKATLL